MADIRAFRGFRYDLGQVGALSDVICPPYDVIDSALQQHLYDSSPYNAVRVELTQEQRGDDDIDNKYVRAARAIKEWIGSNVLRQDTARSLYVLEQTFDVEGQTFTRRGFLARVRLEPFGSGNIFPHEQTFSGPKADRLKLYQATAFNISPIFGLYPDDSNEVFAKLEAVIRNAPPTVAEDHLGVVNKLWVITDTHTVSQIIGLLGPKPVFIADGHHRYETGLKYLEVERAAGDVADDEAPQNYCLMMLVSMGDPGLLIQPTHRLLSGLGSVTIERVKRALMADFELVFEGVDPAACWEHIQLEDSQSVLGFGSVTDGVWIAVKLRDSSQMAAIAPEQTADWRSLAVSILHKLVIDKLIAAEFGVTPTCQYVHLLREVIDAAESKTCQLACLVPPCGMEHVESIAGSREKMPQKSTYFYPKIPTGLVFHSLKKE